MLGHVHNIIIIELTQVTPVVETVVENLQLGYKRLG